MRLFLHYPQGIKKPYNPILGETFRCRWFHPHTDSHTFYIAEQARAPLGCRRALGQGLAVGGEPGPMGASSGPHICCSEALSCQDPPRRRRLCTLAGDSVSISLGHQRRVPGVRGAEGPGLPTGKLDPPWPGLPTARAIPEATSLPTGVPPPTRVCLPRQQPERRLLHQRQHHGQVPVLR